MNEGLITARYVKALYMYAVEEGSLNSVREDIGVLLDCVSQSEEFDMFIQNPLIKGKEKKRIINEILQGKIHKHTLKFLYLLIENKREIYLKSVCIHFIRHYKQKSGIVEAVLTTAQSLTKDHRDEILKIISKKFKIEIDMTEQTDPSIIGGFILRIGDRQINASLQSQLNKIKRELINP